ncbi:MAG: MFS transporter [Candidatus Improbicoccus pseudotrichonymphae]|uniref:MFS transporter n=1 Tax=Candidatus Improbicoccus pseudotrichonymphae TaxID=3033792 RepID=A0AA48KZI0_9FIRM|nr:MAG: MFS transporter [Candidatus Improbicoccus pseudotrichonymphae]
MVNFKKPFFKIIVVILFLFSFVFVIKNYDLFYIFPFSGNYSIENCNFVSFNENENKVIDNKSGLELIKLNKNNEIEFFKKAGVSPVEDFKSVYANRIDDNDNIYTYDLELASNQKIKEESILKFNKNGKLIKNIFRNKSVSENKGIAQILVIKNEFYYVYNNENEFYVKNSLNEVVRKFVFNTELVLCYEFSDLENIILLTKNGYFYKLKPDNSTEIIYDSNKHIGSVPINFAVLEDGTIAYSDIGTRQLAIIRNGSHEREVILDTDENYEERPVYLYLEAKGNADKIKIMATNGNNILNYNSEEKKTEILDKLSFSSSFLFSYCIFIICTTFLLIFIAYISFFIFKKIYISNSFVAKISALIITGTVLITGIFCLISFQSFDARLINEIKKRSEVVSLFIRKELPYEKIEKIKNNSQYTDKDYKDIVNSVKNIFEKYQSITSNFYCVLYKTTHENKVVSVIYDLNATYPTLMPSYNYEEDSDEYKVITTQEGFVSEPEYWPTGYFIYSYDPIVNQKGESIGIIEVGSNLNALKKENHDLMLTLFLNIILMVVFIILFVLEILIFVKERNKAISKILNCDSRDLSKIFSEKITKNVSISMTSGMSRMLTFLIYFTTNIISGFLTIYLFSIVPDINGVQKEFLISIPLSAEIFASLFSLFATSFIIKKIGTRKTASIFGLILISGMFLKIIPNIWVFTLSNILCGLSWGVLLRIVAAILAKKNCLEDFNGNDSSMLNGITCALIFGSFLINFLDYFMVILISALLSLFVIYFIVLYVKNNDIKEFIEKNSEAKSASMTEFLFSGKISMFFLLILIPMTICDYYTSYFFPIVGDSMGLSETYIGYVCTLSRLCSVLFGATMIKFLSKHIKRYLALLLYVFLFSISMILFAKIPTLPILIISVITFGFANSFGYSFLADHFINIKIVEKFGYDRATSTNTFITNIAYMMAPFVFGFIITKSITFGLVYFGTLLIIFGILFLIFNLNIKKIR